jgi:hypothetical protein
MQESIVVIVLDKIEVLCVVFSTRIDQNTSHGRSQGYQGSKDRQSRKNNQGPNVFYQLLKDHRKECVEDF